MQERLKKMLEEAREQLSAANTEKEAEEIRIRFLGKKGQITEVLRSMGKLAPEEKKELGRRLLLRLRREQMQSKRE